MEPYIIAVVPIGLTLLGTLLWAVTYRYGPTEEHPRGRDVIRFEERR